jgi:hypothetical protein
MKNSVYNYHWILFFVQTAFKSNKFIENPIILCNRVLAKLATLLYFSVKKEDPYYTQNAGYISYVLKE